ncbi:hypothetical protein Tco_0727006 [Tanacetum coccineum]|uniref:Uncharacterized protein n=1 Tax=Tanacetum coccineum TaxID=301880 RepID=A0ABQ4YJF9_9ASTR
MVIQKPREPKKKDTQVPQPSGPTEHVADQDIYKELGDILVRAATTASSLEAEHDSGNTLQSDEDRLKLNELMELCTDLQKKCKNENVVEEVVDAAQVSTATTTVIITTEEITLAQALANLKSTKPKAKGIAFREPEPEKPLKKKDQLKLDKEIALKLQDKIEADHELGQRLQVGEQEELYVEEKARLFQQILKKRRKNFAAKRVEEQRNKPSTQAQQRKIMCTYLKNMEGKKLKDLKNKSFDSIQKMFDRAFKRVNTFFNFRTDLVKGSSKRAGEELEQESTKKQKVDEDKDTAELQSLMKVIPDEEEVAIDAVHLATKPPTIFDWKIYKEGKKNIINYESS